MRAKIEARLDQLRAEFASGQQQLANLEAQQSELTQTLLRISGAVQVLEEELSASSEEDGADESN